MTLFTTTGPTITVKGLQRFPARINANNGLSLTTSGGTYTFGFNFSGLNQNTGLANPAEWWTLVYNESTDSYEQVRVDALVDYTIDPRRSIGDVNETITTTDRYVELTASLTAPRTWTLPAAADVTGGVNIIIQDACGGISNTNTLTIQRSGSDTINGASSLVLSSAYDGAVFYSDGSSKWTFLAKPGVITRDKLPAGTILQVVQATTSTTFLTSSSTFADTNLAASITPSSASSKVLVIANQQYALWNSTNAAALAGIRLVRGSTTILSPLTGSGAYELHFPSVSNSYFLGRHSIVYLDSPSTTSATTYKTQGASGSVNSNLQCQSSDTTPGTSTIILMEVAA